MMSKKDDRVVELSKRIGIEEEEALVLRSMYLLGLKSPLTISKQLQIPRTTVYRLLESLVARKLVTVAIGSRGKVFSPISLDQFDFLLLSKQSEFIEFKKGISELKDEISRFESNGSSKQEVRYYNTLDGLKQVTYNSTKANGLLYTYEVGTMNSFMDYDEAEELRAIFLKNSVKVKTLTNLKEIDGWTDYSEIVSGYWDIRHIPPKEKEFEFEILIYNDIYAMYRYLSDSIFCIEIKSEELASMQKQLFNYLWDGAKRFEILNERGKAKLIE